MEIKSNADFVRMTRGALAASGFTRQEEGGSVWWTSNVVPSGAPDSQSGAGWAESPSLQKAPFVLIHGANDQAGTWFTIAPFLARRYRVILPDLAGHGESEPASGPIPISLILRRLEMLLADERDLTILGNSLGGWLALLYTLRHPEQVSRLFLEASGGLNRPIASKLVAQNREEALEILRNVHGPRFVPPEWAIEALIARAAGSPMLRLTEVLEHDIESRLGEIHVPATLLWGADDGVLPLDYAEELQRRIPNARLQVIEGAAHIPHLQQPEKILQCLTATS